MTSAKFIRGTQYSLVAALTIDGYIAVRVVEGSIDGALFAEFIMDDVVSFAITPGFLHSYLIKSNLNISYHR